MQKSQKIPRTQKAISGIQCAAVHHGVLSIAKSAAVMQFYNHRKYF